MRNILCDTTSVLIIIAESAAIKRATLRLVNGFQAGLWERFVSANSPFQFRRWRSRKLKPSNQCFLRLDLGNLNLLLFDSVRERSPAVVNSKIHEMIRTTIRTKCLSFFVWSLNK